MVWLPTPERLYIIERECTMGNGQNLTKNSFISAQLYGWLFFFSLFSLLHVLKEQPLNGHVPSRYVPGRAVRHLVKANAFSNIPSSSHWVVLLQDHPLPFRLTAFQQQKLCTSNSKTNTGTHLD